MKFAVMGVGAVGCYYGGMLARSGHEVTLIARPRHVEAVRAQGLLLDTQTFREHVRLQADTEPSGVPWAQGGRDGFSRAYLHHLDRCGEMLGPMLATVHNLHYYLNLMREIRAALDEGRFAAFVTRFHAERAQGV